MAADTGVASQNRSKKPAFKLLATGVAFLLLATAGCSAEKQPQTTLLKPPAIAAPPAVEIPTTILISSGDTIIGSDAAEREYAYTIDEAAYGHSTTRNAKWYDSERSRQSVFVESFEITASPVTNAQYASFINATSRQPPTMDQQTWAGYGLVHPYSSTKRFQWTLNKPPMGREQHPVVLVSYHDAVAYAQWLSEITASQWRLPTESEWEKASRGTSGWHFPWGDEFNPDNLNSHDRGPFDTVDAGQRSTPNQFGVLDTAGQVFEWIQTPQANRAWVKGGSWDDKGCGVCRPAARHSRDKALRHILVGIRLVKQ